MSVKTFHVPPLMVETGVSGGYLVQWAATCRHGVRATGQLIGRPRRGMGSQP